MTQEVAVHICTIMWSNYLPLIKEAADVLGISLSSFSTKQLNTAPDLLDQVKSSLRSADCILLYWTNDAYWDELEVEIRALRDRIPVVVVGSDPSFWALSSVAPETVATVYRYVLYNGRDNLTNMLRFLIHSIFEQNIDYAEPEEIPWQGIYHPEGSEVFQETESYLSYYRSKLGFMPSDFVGILYSRSAWATGNLNIERSLVTALEESGPRRDSRFSLSAERSRPR